jgi:hypothetical protein
VWKILWSLKVPAKIKIHWWRSLLGAIPCFGVLANRHVPISSQSPLCSVDCESIRHTFFQCDRAKQIWRCLSLLEAVNIACAQDREGASVLSSLLLDKEAKCPLMPEVCRNDLITTTIWYIWWERRQFTHWENIQIPARSAQAISASVTNYSWAKWYPQV